MKSNKQRRAEIKQLRLERAARATAHVQGVDRLDPRALRTLGAEIADQEALARHNAPSACISRPEFYVDRPFRCRDCGSQEVWTAKQQKWWYETIGAKLDSRANRCLPCRRQRRAAIAKAQAVPGADLLRQEVAWLRGVGASRPDAETERRVEAALTSKWDGVRKVAIEVLGRWCRPQDAERLRTWALDKGQHWYGAQRQAAAQALTPLLRHPDDDVWVLEAFASTQYAPWPWSDFVRGIAVDKLDDVLRDALERGDLKRLENVCWLLQRVQRVPSEPLWSRLRKHPTLAARMRPEFIAS
ncbi:hypothetical protein DBR42_06915 [Pelomonas sp. HMWF004]|nr:hypothetical protein DBR42_06915 [Pelomonas sp. HMWF004]